MEEIRDSLHKRKRKGPARPGYGGTLPPSVPLRKFQIANFSLILGRLNRRLTGVGQNTYIKAISTWREKRITALDVIKTTWTPHDEPVKTATDQLKYLTHGSPTMRYAFHLVRGTVSRAKDYKGHKKVLFCEALPLNAWFLALVLRHAYIGVAVMHADLSQDERSKLAELFNDPKSWLT